MYFTVRARNRRQQQLCDQRNRARKQYADVFIREEKAEGALRNLIMNNTTGIVKDLVPGRNLISWPRSN